MMRIRIAGKELVRFAIIKEVMKGPRIVLASRQRDSQWLRQQSGGASSCRIEYGRDKGEPC
jgi:hypothetical protein